MLIAIVSGLLLNYILPRLTSRSQSHAKSVQLKVELVTQMTETVAGPIAHARLMVRGLVPPDADDLQKEYNDELRDLDQRGAVIGARLGAYLPDRQEIGAEWKAYVDAVGYVYRLSALGDPADRRASHVQVVRVYVTTHRSPTDLDWDVLIQKTAELEQVYNALTEWMLKRGEELAQAVLQASIGAL